jgi:hypothetical protein
MRRLSSFSLAVVLAATSLIGASAASAATKSPAEVLRLSISAMHSAGSFHYESTASVGGVVAITLSTDSALNYGDQVQKLGGGVETTRLIGKTLYMNADAKAYAADFGVKKTTLANEWVLVPSSNKNYANISSAILVPSVLQQLVDVNHLKEVGVGSVNGQAALKIRGDAGASGTETVYVSTAAPYLPIAVAAVGTEDGEKVSDELVFSKWGEKFSVAKPAKFAVATNVTFP